MEFHCWGKCNVVIDILRDGTNTTDRDLFNNRHHTVYQKIAWGHRRLWFDECKKKKYIIKKNTGKEMKKEERERESKRNVQAAGVNDIKIKAKLSRWCCIFLEH